MKKVLLVIMILTMLANMVGCANQPQKQSAAPSAEMKTSGAAQDPKPFKIGFPWMTTSTDPTMVSLITNFKAAVEAAGGELVLVESDLTADTLINNISELISRDVDGIVFMPASDSMLPTVNQMCSEAGVPYSTFCRIINDENIRAQIHGSDYFAGGCYEDEVKCAYTITKELVGMGVKNLCVINIAKGDTSSDLRDQGIEKAVEETGINLLNTTYNVMVPNDMTRTIESYVAAYPEMDGILLAGTYCDAALPTIQKALADHKLAGKVIVGRIDFDYTMGKYLEEGSFHISYGGQQQFDPLLSLIILINKVIGTPIKEDGPVILVVNYLKLTSSQEAEDYLTYFLGDIPIFTSEEIKESMIKFYNPDIDESTFKVIIDNFTVADVAARHKDLIK
jgi:ABC-type sugar transport system substrate-binding protein